MAGLDTSTAGGPISRARMSALVLGIALTLVTGLAVAAVKAPLVALVVVAGAVLLGAAVFFPDLITVAVVILIYSNAAVIAVRVHHVPAFVGAAVPLLLLVPLANQVLAKRQPIVLASALPWALAYLAVQIVSALLSSDTPTSWQSATQFLFEGLLLFFVVTNVVRTPQSLRRLVWALLFVGAFLGGLTAYQTLTKDYGRSYYGFAQPDELGVQAYYDAAGTIQPVDSQPPRQGGPLGEPNRYAQIMAALLPLGLLQLTQGRSTVERAIALGATALIAVAIAYTFSRGAAVGIAVGVLAALLLRFVRLRELALLGVVFVAFVLAVPGYAARLATIATAPGAITQNTSRGVADGAIRGRLGEAAAGLKIFADHPLLGVGPGMYALKYHDYVKGSGFKVRLGPRQAHNLLLDIASETGLIGLGCFLGAVVATLWELTRARRRLLVTDPRLAGLVTSIALAILVYLGTSLFLQLSYERYFWLWLALGAAASTLTPRSADASAS
ncbi:MAG: O-antigen ligase family protein [Egibacteraceae bacterium]